MWSLWFEGMQWEWAKESHDTTQDVPNLTYQFAKSTAPNSLNQTYQTKLMSVQMVVRRLDEYEAENEQGPVGDTRNF